MELDVREERWAKRLAEAQKTKNELVRLLGLLNVLNSVTAREESLEVGAKSIALNLVDYLNLKFCGFYVRQDKVHHLLAYAGEYPALRLVNLIEGKIKAGDTSSQGPDPDPQDEQVFCLPISSNKTKLGALAILPLRPLDDKERRHLRLAIEAIAPVLETFLLRNQLHQLNRHLGQIASRSLRKVNSFQRQNKENQAYVENLLQTNPHPLFITDKTSHLVKCNKAFTRLLGWDQDYLLGKKLKDFLADPNEWSLVSQLLARSQSPVEQEVQLRVHCGIRSRARLYLIPLFTGKKMNGALGRLEEAEKRKGETNGPFSLQEAMVLAHLSGEAVDHINSLLTAFRCHLQLLLLQDVLPPVRKRLELLESLTQDQDGVIHQVQLCVDAIAQKCRSVTARQELWQDPRSDPPRPALKDFS